MPEHLTVRERSHLVDQPEQAFGIRRAQVDDQRQRATALPAFAPCQRVELQGSMARAIAVQARDGAGQAAPLEGPLQPP